jgi:hypothetical protein
LTYAFHSVLQPRANPRTAIMSSAAIAAATRMRYVTVNTVPFHSVRGHDSPKNRRSAR